ncbi:hypothetical protein GE21DRAFT_1119488 [Neurospora crassa]|nr:hypothetical protein GE21DRAFT_1119488 [Neurospora crassa]
MRPQRPSFLGFHDPASGNPLQIRRLPPTVTASMSDLAAQRHFQQLQQPQGVDCHDRWAGIFHGAPSAFRRIGNPGLCIPHGERLPTLLRYRCMYIHMSL